MVLLHADWFRGPFVPMGDDEPMHIFARRMRERERRVPFRRWRPVWQVQLSPAPGLTVITDEPSSVPIRLSAYSNLMRRARAVEEGKRQASAETWVRVIDVGTGDCAFVSKGE